MKRTFFIPMLVIIALLVFSCKKNEEARAPADDSSDEIEVLSADSVEWNYGYVLRLNASLMTLETDTSSESDKAKWAVSMALGEKVSIGETRQATYDGRVYDFVKVRRDDGREGLAFPTQIATGGELAVVVDDRGNLYTSPKAVDVTGIILPRKTIAVRFPETEREGYVEVRAYDPAAQTYRQNYMRLASLSGKESDIQSSILLQTAEPLKNEGAEKNRRDALLEAALFYPDSAFSADINALVGPNAVVIKTESVNQHLMTVIDDEVNIRDLPDPVAGRVIGQLNRNERVRVIEQTENQSNVGEEISRWYRITEPLEGWVFGVYLE